VDRDLRFAKVTEGGATKRSVDDWITSGSRGRTLTTPANVTGFVGANGEFDCQQVIIKSNM
jgi:hypothetical protein